MFKLTFYRPHPWPFTPKMHIFTTPSEETATIMAGALMNKGYCVRLWGRRDQLIF